MTTLPERVAACELAFIAVASVELGDVSGHDFHGNQYSDVASSALKPGDVIKGDPLFGPAARLKVLENHPPTSAVVGPQDHHLLLVKPADRATEQLRGGGKFSRSSFNRSFHKDATQRVERPGTFKQTMARQAAASTAKHAAQGEAYWGKGGRPAG